ncbi:hypothetical protein J0910_06915 [Nocardiopsis sp. CNT-189]|uniref:hypothetical protein n=1 Tax=Nocardiopsis oceanisediminis TaxID=2816862 RepID=UPI003B2C768D
MVPTAAVLGVALMATGVWASNTVINDLFGGPQPDRVFPADSIAYAQVDLKPSASEMAGYAGFVGKLPDSVREDINDEEDPAADFFEESFDYLDYEKDVAPWLGRRFGAAAFPSGEGEQGVAGAVAIAVTDESAATEALDKISAEEDVEYVIRDGFAVFSDSSSILSDMEGRIESDGSLTDAPEFSADMDAAAGDSIAAGWFDIGAASKLAGDALSSATGGASDYGYSDYSTGPEVPDLQELDITGRAVAAVSVESDYLEVRGDLLDFSAAGFSLDEYEPSQTGLTELGELPDDTVLGFGGSGLDQLSEQAWGDLSGAIPEITEEIEAGAAETGSLRIPGDFGKILGTQTAFGTNAAGGDDPFSDFESGAFQYRAAGADKALFDEMAEAAAADSYSSGPGVKEEGGTVVLSSGSSSQGKLGDDPVYQQVMQGTEQASLGYYMDMRALMESTEDAPDADQWGAVGLTTTFSDGKASSLLRWAPSGG